MENELASWRLRMPLLGLLDFRAEEIPAAILVNCFDGSLSRRSTVDYRNALLCRLASEWSVRQGDRVVLIESSSKYFVVALAAIAAVGAIAIPVGSTWSDASLARIVETTTPKLAIRFLDSPSLVLNVEHFLIGDQSMDSTLQLFGNEHNVEYDEITAASPFLILFTTGTTGDPKGVVVSHQANLAALESIAQYLRYPAGSRILLALSPSFDYGLYQYFLAIHSGGTLYVAKRPAFALDVLDFIERNSISIAPLVPSQWRAIASVALAEKKSLAHLEIATSTGSCIDASLMRRILSVLPRARFYSMYGLTECKRVSFLNPDLASLKPTSVGKPMPNCAIRIVNDGNFPVERGQIGQLVVRGPNVASGYWSHIDDPNSPFKRSPISGEIEIYTGDYFSQDQDGDLFFCGRRDDIVKVNDLRLSLLDVDRYLLSLTCVVDAVAFVRTHEQGLKLAAKVVLNRSSALATLRSDLHRQGAPRHLIPQDIEEVIEIPLNANGKPVRG